MDTKNSIIMICLWFGGCLIGGLLAYWKSKKNNSLEPDPKKQNEATNKFLAEHPKFKESLEELLSDFPYAKYKLTITPKKPGA